ncbi:hypothetical protein R1sor_016384 [Riccia sorocarpa]|uniref:Uncharacterized protein n=1 Tax=Riccia sorocarpa TaxID=122646 RepID=A0ABD3HEU2_9MARC
MLRLWGAGFRRSIGGLMQWGRPSYIVPEWRRPSYIVPGCWIRIRKLRLEGTRGQTHDALQKSLVFSHSRHGPSARLVLWKNYPEFDSIAVRTKPGDLIRAHLANRETSEVDEIESEKQSFLGSLLGRALSTFVHSQLESCSHVEVRIAGSNQELFRGQVKKVKISAKQAVFKGISFSDVKISATSIRLRFGQEEILQEPLHVKASIAIGEEDFKTSLGSPVLFEHMKELLPRQYSTPKVYQRFKSKCGTAIADSKMLIEGDFLITP